MGLWRAIREMNADYLFFSDDQVATTEQVRQAQLARLRDQAARGVVNSEESAQLEARAAGIGYDNLAPEDSPWHTFREEAAASVGRLPEGVTGGINRFFTNLLGSIPWTVWLLLFAFLAWKFGLFNKLARR